MSLEFLQPCKSIKTTVVDPTGQYSAILWLAPLDKRQSSLSVLPTVEHVLGAPVTYLRGGGSKVTVQIEEQPSRCCCAKLFPWSEYADDAPRSPWQRPGWVQDLIAELDRDLPDLGLLRTGRPITRKSDDISCVLRVPCNEGGLWVKALHPAFRSEPAVLTMANEIVSNVTLEVLSEQVRPWGSYWLSLERRLGRSNEMGALGALLSDVQYSSVAYLPGAVGTVPSNLPSLLLDDRTPLSLSTKTPAHLISRIHQTQEVVRLKVRGTDIDEYLTLTHGDFAPQNTWYSQGRWLICDWTDASISNPYFDLVQVAWARMAPLVRAFHERWIYYVGRRRARRLASIGQLLGTLNETIKVLRLIHMLPQAASKQAMHTALTWIQRCEHQLVVTGRKHVYL